jgi:hypothetical protein
MCATKYEHIQGWFLGYIREVENSPWAGSEQTKIAEIITCVAMTLDVFFFINYDAMTNHDTRLYRTIKEEPYRTEGSSSENLVLSGCIACV